MTMMWCWNKTGPSNRQPCSARWNYHSPHKHASWWPVHWKLCRASWTWSLQKLAELQQQATYSYAWKIRLSGIQFMLRWNSNSNSNSNSNLFICHSPQFKPVYELVRKRVAGAARKKRESSAAGMTKQIKIEPSVEVSQPLFFYDWSKIEILVFFLVAGSSDSCHLVSSGAGFKNNWRCAQWEPPEEQGLFSRTRHPWDCQYGHEEKTDPEVPGSEQARWDIAQQAIHILLNTVRKLIGGIILNLNFWITRESRDRCDHVWVSALCDSRDFYVILYSHNTHIKRLPSVWAQELTFSLTPTSISVKEKIIIESITSPTRRTHGLDESLCSCWWWVGELEPKRQFKTVRILLWDKNFSSWVLAPTVTSLSPNIQAACFCAMHLQDESSLGL